MAQRPRQLVCANWLGQVVVHPGREARFAILRPHVRGHGDDAGADPRRPALADPTGGVETVQLGHLDVHQDDVVGLPLECVQGLQAIPRHVRSIPEPIEESECDLLVHGVVLGEEDA